MKAFEEFRQAALARKGSEAALEEAISGYDFARDISTLSDDRILAEFSKRVFQAGFNWSVIEKKWDRFETGFHGFDVGRNAFMSDEDLDAHLKDTGIVRHATKILSVRDNAIFLSDLAQEHGSAAQFFQNWPRSDLVGLWDVMKKRGARLGGSTGQYALRLLGKDSFILSGPVVRALTQAGVVDGKATGKGAQKKVQEAFNVWHAESGESYTRMSRILAMSLPD